MNKVDRSRLKPEDTTDWAERPKLFVDAFGGWDFVEYSSWISRQMGCYFDQLSEELGYRPKIITNQGDFTDFLRAALKGGVSID